MYPDPHSDPMTSSLCLPLELSTPISKRLTSNSQHNVMLHCYITLAQLMSIGRSGRIVIEIDPEMKARLYGALHERDLTLKEWFLAHAAAEVRRIGQSELNLQEAEAQNFLTGLRSSD